MPVRCRPEHSARIRPVTARAADAWPAPGRLGRLGAVGLAALLLAGCSILPRSGPYRSDMMAVKERMQGHAVLIELDQRVAEALAPLPEPTLEGVFGDYRPAGEQRIGVGDLVEITLWEAASGGLFSGPASSVSPGAGAGAHSAAIPPQVVARDGAITVPFAGRVPVVGRTPPAVEQEIVGRLADKAINPQAVVTVARNVSNTVTVMGESGPGARVPLSVRGDRLLDAIAAAGGIRAPVSDITVALSRDNRTVRVPLEEVLDTPRENIYLRPDDQVVLIRNPQSISVFGALGRNGDIPFGGSTLTLDSAMAKAGGLLDDRANPAGVFILRYEPAAAVQVLPPDVRTSVPPPQNGFVAVVYHLDMADPAAMFTSRHFVMRNNDILYVSDAPIVDVNKLFNLFGQLVAPAVAGLTINAYAP